MRAHFLHKKNFIEKGKTIKESTSTEMAAIITI
jgi:hypothetical protein